MKRSSICPQSYFPLHLCRFVSVRYFLKVPINKTFSIKPDALIFAHLTALPFRMNMAGFVGKFCDPYVQFYSYRSRSLCSNLPVEPLLFLSFLHCFWKHAAQEKQSEPYEKESRNQKINQTNEKQNKSVSLGCPGVDLRTDRTILYRAVVWSSFRKCGKHN